MHDIIIVGAGGFGREMANWLPDCLSPSDYRLKGFLAKNSQELDGYGIDAPVLDDPEAYPPQPGDRFLLAIGDIGHRRRIARTMCDKGAEFLTLIHPTALISETAQIGRGTVIFPYSIVSNHTRIGDYTFLSLYASIGHDAQVGDYCYLSPYATLNGFSVIEDDVFMGTHSTVTPLKRVGRGSKVSANSVVMHDVAPESLVFGVPGRQTRRLS